MLLLSLQENPAVEVVLAGSVPIQVSHICSTAINCSLLVVSVPCGNQTQA